MSYTVAKERIATTTTYRKRGRADNVVPHVATVELYCIDHRHEMYDIYHDNGVEECIEGIDKAWEIFDDLIKRIREQGYVWDSAAGYRIMGEY